MISPQLAAGLTTVVGLSMLAGWLTALRNRAYLGWLGLAFLCISGYVLAAERARLAHDLGLSGAGATEATRVLLVASIISFLLSLVSAARETVRRIRDIHAGHRAAEEALLAIISAQRDSDEEKEPEDDEGDSHADGANDADG